MVVTKKLRGRILPHAKRSCRKHADTAFRHSIEIGSESQKFRGRSLHVSRRAALHGGFEVVRAEEKAPVRRQRNRVATVAVEKLCQTVFSRRSIGQHSFLFSLNCQNSASRSAAVPIVFLLNENRGIRFPLW